MPISGVPAYGTAQELMFMRELLQLHRVRPDLVVLVFFTNDILAESAYFGLAFVNIGLMPDGGSTALVPPAVGRVRAFQMALLGERIPSAQALDWGLVNWVHPDERLIDEANALAERLAAGPTRSYAASKQALNASIYGDLDRQLELEAELQHELARSKDFLEGVAAFVEKREAAFGGA